MWWASKEIMRRCAGGGVSLNSLTWVSLMRLARSSTRSEDASPRSHASWQCLVVRSERYVLVIAAKFSSASKSSSAQSSSSSPRTLPFRSTHPNPWTCAKGGIAQDIGASGDNATPYHGGGGKVEAAKAATTSAATSLWSLANYWDLQGKPLPLNIACYELIFKGKKVKRILLCDILSFIQHRSNKINNHICIGTMICLGRLLDLLVAMICLSRLCAMRPRLCRCQAGYIMNNTIRSKRNATIHWERIRRWNFIPSSIYFAHKNCCKTRIGS